MHFSFLICIYNVFENYSAKLQSYNNSDNITHTTHARDTFIHGVKDYCASIFSLDSILCAFGIFCWPTLFLKHIYNRLTFFSYNKQIILYKNIYDARTQHRVVAHAKLLLHRVLFSRETHFYDHFSCF